MPIAPHHIPKQKHKVTNWRDYDASLRQRGSLTVWFSDEAVAAWKAEPRTTRGGQRSYSPLAILTALTLRAVFRLALRQTEGLIGSAMHLLVDSTGLKLCGAGEWLLEKHGTKTRRSPRSPATARTTRKARRQRRRAPSRGGRHRAAALDRRAQRDGRDRTHTA